MSPPTEKATETVRLTDTTLNHLEALMSQAVRKGIHEAMNEEAAERFWGAGLNVLQRQATTHAGRFVIGGLWGLARRASMFLVLGGVVYAIGGWGALAGPFKTLFTNGAPQ